MRSSPPNIQNGPTRQSGQRPAGTTGVKRPFNPAEFKPSGPPIEVKHIPIRPLKKSDERTQPDKKTDE